MDKSDDYMLSKLIDGIQTKLPGVVDWDMVFDGQYGHGTVWTVCREGAACVITAHLFWWDKLRKCWDWMRMTEAEGPAALSCPLRFFAMAPVRNEAWRDSVHAFVLSPPIVYGPLPPKLQTFYEANRAG